MKAPRRIPAPRGNVVPMPDIRSQTRSPVLTILPMADDEECRAWDAVVLAKAA